MEFAPDGRLFVAEQGGRLRVIKNGALLPTPFVTLTVDSSGERGLLGVAFDPDFATNHFVYVYYTATTPGDPQPRQPLHGQRRRRPWPGSEVVLLDLEQPERATNHNGGAIHFGPDGKLYVAVGENANGANSQTLDNLLGQDAAHQRRRHDPGRQPVLRTADRHQPRDLGAGPAQPVHLRVPARHRRGCSSTTSARTPGKRSTTASPAPTTAGRLTEGPTDDPRFAARPLLRVRPSTRRLRHHRRRVLQPADGCSFPASYVGQLLLRRLLRRLDCEPRRGTATRHRLRHRTSARPST